MSRQRSFLLLLASAGIVLLAATLSGRGQAPAPQGQPPPSQLRGGTGLITGQVVDGVGHPVTDAVVTIGGRGGPVDRVLVDPGGRFVFRGLTAGVFGVVAARPGYLGGAVDQHEPTSAARPIELSENQQLTDVTLRLWKNGAIAGTVTGDANEPIAGVDVHAIRRALVGGQWIGAVGPAATTDDQGRYRFDALVPGEYAIVAKPTRDPETAVLLTMLSTNPAVAADAMAAVLTTNRARPETDDRVRNYPMTFYPAAATLAGASLVTVTPGSDRLKTDFRLKLTRVVRVSGTIADASAASDGLTLQLVPADANGAPGPIEAGVTACDEDGRFEFTGVPPGRYVITVQSAPPQVPAGQPPTPGGPAGQFGGPASPPGQAPGQPPAQGRPSGPGGPPMPPALPMNPAWSGSVLITAGTTDLTNVAVPIQKGVVITGRVTFEGAAPRLAPAQLAQITLRLDPADQVAPAGAPTWRGQVEPDGRFRTMSLPPGEYLLRVVTPPRGWTPLSAMFGGVDLFDVPIAIDAGAVDDVVIAFGDGPLATATGNVRDGQGASATDASVLVFPTDRALWRDSSAQARRVRLARVSSAGRFGALGLPSGEYFAVAVSGELPSEWQDPRRLEALAKVATRVRLAPGAPQPIELTVVKNTFAVRRAPAGRDAFVGRRADLSGPPAAGPERPGLRTEKPSTPAPDPTRTAALSGVVLDHLTRRPVTNATVLVAGTDVGLMRVTATDERGQFSFAGLPAGHFLVGTGKSSYLTAVHGAARPGRPGTLLALEAGQRVGSLSLALLRGGVITGRVTDDHERPVPGARVRVVQHRAFAGEVAMTGEAGDPTVVMTDDLGIYRVFDLPPGEYAVAVQARGVVGGDVRRLTEADIDHATSSGGPLATQPNGMAIGWAPAYFPGTSSPAGATAIALKPGEARTNVDVRMRLARFVRVEGTVASFDSAAPPNPQMTLRPRGLNASGVILTNLTTRPGPDGRFMFPTVPPGEYTLVARSLPPPPGPQDRPFAGAQAPAIAATTAVRWATADVTVNEENVTDIALALRPGLAVSGRVQIEGLARLPADLPLIRIGVRATPGSAVQNVPEAVLIDREGRFSIGGLVPGRYRLFAQVPNADVLQVPVWFAKTAVIDGVTAGDALDVPFEIGPAAAAHDALITLTGETQEVDGVVRDAAGRPIRDCTVVVFPVDRRFWFQQSRRIVARQSNRDGQFVFGMSAGLPAGEYFLAAVPDGRPGEQLDVLLLEELAATAVKVTLDAGDGKTVDLRVIRP